MTTSTSTHQSSTPAVIMNRDRRVIAHGAIVLPHLVVVTDPDDPQAVSEAGPWWVELHPDASSSPARQIEVLDTMIIGGPAGQAVLALVLADPTGWPVAVPPRIDVDFDDLDSVVELLRAYRTTPAVETTSESDAAPAEELITLDPHDVVDQLKIWVCSGRFFPPPPFCMVPDGPDGPVGGGTDVEITD